MNVLSIFKNGLFYNNQHWRFEYRFEFSGITIRAVLSEKNTDFPFNHSKLILFIWTLKRWDNEFSWGTPH